MWSEKLTAVFYGPAPFFSVEFCSERSENLRVLQYVLLPGTKPGPQSFDCAVSSQRLYSRALVFPGADKNCLHGVPLS